MEMFLYLLGNVCCIVAASLVLFKCLRRTVQERNKLRANGEAYNFSFDAERDYMISFDLQVMLALGTLVRVYWSLSPPVIWTDEPLLLELMCQLDLIFSLLVWPALLGLSILGAPENSLKRRNSFEMDGGTFGIHPAASMGGAEKEEKKKWMSWPYLTALAAVVAALATLVLPSLSSHDAFPFVDFAVIANMLLDGFAMIPQVTLIHRTNAEPTPESSHFVGLLCLGRVLRMVFWIWLVLHPLSGHAIWTFVVPDLIHTAIMGDYLWTWIQFVKKSRVDPMMEWMASNV